MAPDNLRSLKVYLTMSAAAVAKLPNEVNTLDVVVRDDGDGTETRRGSTFRRPKP